MASLSRQEAEFQLAQHCYCNCNKCFRARNFIAKMEPLNKQKLYSLDDIMYMLKNLGIDLACGACLEIAFTGVTTSSHECKLLSQINNTCNRINM